MSFIDITECFVYTFPSNQVKESHMVQLTGELGKKFAQMLSIDERHISVVDSSSVFVAEVNGSHIQHKRSFCMKQKAIMDKRPEVGKSYPALISYSAGKPTIHLNATITNTFHDDGYKHARIIQSKSVDIEISLGQQHSKKTPGYNMHERIQG